MTPQSGREFVYNVLPNIKRCNLMAWEIESSSEYLEWWHELSLAQQKSIDRILQQLAEHGPSLPVRYSRR